MNTTVRRGAVVVLLVFSVACGSSGPTSPSETSQRPRLPSPPSIVFPPLSGPSSTFIFDSELSYRVRDFTRNSRVVLYDNGAFVLEYPPSQFGDGRFAGRYRDANGVLMFLFKFNGRTVDQAWDDATGTLNGDSLTIRYHELMQHADFEDAVYALTEDLARVR